MSPKLKAISFQALDRVFRAHMLTPLARIFRLRRLRLALGALLLAVVATGAGTDAQNRFITVASTTSTEQSGLFAHLLPRFTARTGIDVRVVAVGTGQALDIARRGDADLVLVHDGAAEEAFVADGFGVKRFAVMYNDFILVGPKGDPARAASADIAVALRRIAAARAPFVSRGDRSGTHAAELRAWQEAGLDLAAVRGDWYREIGQGMGPALNAASASNAYVLSDRGTWLSFRNRGDLAILVEGDQRLFNPYAVILVNPAKHPHVKAADGQAFIDWLIGAEGQQAIADYNVGGEQLFLPAAIPLPRGEGRLGGSRAG
jgi:tungstate transport system substrate-binding protein